jgi:serine/threonine-protein kinase
MPVGSDELTDPRFANLDEDATIELCSSLADYGEAGGLSKDLMLQVGRYAETRYERDLDVQLAAARMYMLGGETTRAKAVLVRAAKLGADARVSALLAQVNETLGDPAPASERGAGRSDSLPPILQPRHATPSPDYGGRGPKSDAARPTTKIVAPVVSAGRQTTPMGARQVRAAAARTGAAPAAAPVAMTPPARAQIITPVNVQTEVARRAIPKDAFPDSEAPPVSEDGRRPVSGPAPARHLRSDAPGLASDPPDPLAITSRPPPSERAADRPRPDPMPTRTSGAVPRSVRTTRIRLLDPDDDGRQLQPYELLGEIASGGMATVYLGRLVGAGGFQRFVAIKRLHPHLAREEQFVEMFLDEARLAAGIHNPHVVPILEVGQNHGGYYLVMEFVEGDTLAGLTIRSLQRGEMLPARVAARIVFDALTGLHAAHQLTDAEGRLLGLVHRDCTPQNILVGIDGSARITDFGVARAASRLAITRPQQVKGKVGYLSPEQAHAQEIDRRSDVFTMGIVLWEALAGRPLFQADTEAATLTRLLQAPIPSVRSFVPDTPPELDEVCRRALHRDRNRRFKSAAQMAEAIEKAAHTDGFGGIASPRDLGKYVDSLMGAEIAAQRDAVRAFLAQTDAAAAQRSSRLSITNEISAVPPRVEEAAPLAKTPTPPPVAARVEEPSAAKREEPAVEEKKAEEKKAAEPEPEAKAEAAKPANEAPKPKAEGSAPPAAEGAAKAAALFERVAGAKPTSPRGMVVIALLILIATAPAWLKITNKLLHRPRGAATAVEPKGNPAPRQAPKATPTSAPTAPTGAAWDEWPVPSGEPSATP